MAATQVSVKRVRIAVVGSYGVGLTMYLERAPLPGETLLAESFVQGPGGKGSNQAIAARRLGAHVMFCSIVGPDDFGEGGRRLWADEGIDASGVVTGSAPTMLGFIIVERDGENRIAIAPGALAELGAADVREFAPNIVEADALLTNLEIATTAAREALEIASRAGVTAILNPAPASAEAAAILALADHITPNRTEAATLTGLDPQAPAAELLDALRRLAPAAHLTLTMGADGVVVDPPHGGRRTLVEAVPVPQPVDSAGAGDAFSAAYTVALAAGRSTVDAARLGALAGAFAVTRRQVVPGLGTLAELAEFARSVGIPMPTL